MDEHPNFVRVYMKYDGNFVAGVPAVFKKFWNHPSLILDTYRQIGNKELFTKIRKGVQNVSN